ncbi:hypothetical protein NBT05_03470 [Aquimarina sp. ERC-38]|uniref:hypothetical protein n=1 Tax=Aquimarina sp. ERC-38 TaxID=2949996 RepID=UPI002246A855|nr:hypothetical protein [Aquimarina sp. ERC-38]UZO81540.1 hypothetical protein NBT05_03470 [Aquimarina sp. ERC-38]
MKKILIILSIAYNICCAQNSTGNISNAELFSSKAGTLIEKEFIGIGKIGEAEIQILRITDMIAGESIRSLRIKLEVKDTYSSDSKIAQLDSDEIDGLIKSMNIIKESVFGVNPKNYTEITFRSRSGFEAGCFWNNNNEWSSYLQVERNNRKSIILLERGDYNELLGLLEIAKNKIYRNN